MESQQNTNYLKVFYLIIISILVATSALLEPLISPRPDDPEQILKHKTYVDIHKVESRLWQDPLATIERRYHQLNGSSVNSDLSIDKQIKSFTKQLNSKRIEKINIIAVSLPGDDYSEALEIHRRNRFAVISALSRGGYYPKESEMLMFFRYASDFSKKEPPKREVNVPYEWFEKDENRNQVALVVWLNEHKITSEEYFQFISSLFRDISTNLKEVSDKIAFNLIGPSSTPLFLELLKKDPIIIDECSHDSNRVRVISPNATISELDISKRITLEIENFEADPMKLADCKSSVKYNLKKRSIVRSSGTDDMLAKALVWELQQRGINKAISLFGFLKKEILCVMNQCEQDSLVLIHEQDSSYSRDLARLIKNEFNEISNTKDSVKTFAYFRGLDGKIPDIKDNDKEPVRNEKKEISGLLAQMDDAPPEHAEGRNQFDYLRRLTDVIEKLDVDSDSHRIRAIGIIGNDVYDKLIILRALRERFRDKVFFTTDLDARYLHADQNKWSRNLVVASNFDLTMNEGLQSSTMPFRASYQTSTFFATLLAIQDSEKSEASDQVLEEKLNKWLRPQIFEIGNTEAIHLASLSTHCLNGKIKDEKTNNCIEKAQSDFNENLLSTKGNDSFDVLTYESIEPSRTPKISPIKLIVIINSLILGLGIFCYCHLRNLSATCQQSNTSKFLCFEKKSFIVWITLGIFIFLIQYWMVKDNFPTHYNGEPLIWSEGISVWPNLLIRFFWGFIGSDFGNFDLSQNFRTDTTKRKDFSEDYKKIWDEYKNSVGLNKETLPRIILFTVIGLMLSGVVFIFYPLNFPARGYITANLHDILRFSQFFAIWFLIFWVHHEIKNCICFVNKLNKQDKDKCIFSSEFLEKKEKEYRIPKTDLDSYLRFKLIVDVSESINSLIYLPFIMIFVVTIGRSTYFDALGLPLSLIVVFVFEVLLLSWMVYRLRNSANSVRDKILKHYEEQIPKETRSNSLNNLIEDIRNTQQGVYASYMNHPLISAILLPIGGISGLHIFEYFFG